MRNSSPATCGEWNNQPLRLRHGLIRNFLGETQTPLQTVAAVQALRNARLVEEFAHGPYQPLNFIEPGQSEGRFHKLRGFAMALAAAGVIAIPDARGSSFDHGAFEPETRRVFIAHTARDSLEVVDAATSRHVATLRSFPEAAGVVANKGCVLVTNRGGASLTCVDARSLATRIVLDTAPRPNGVAIAFSLRVAVAACIGDDTHGPQLQVLGLEGDRRWAIDLPGRPRWCVVDAKQERVFLAIREPSMVLVAQLPELTEVQHWPLPCHGAHGMDIDHQANLLYVACDGGLLVEVDARSGKIRRDWPLPGGPDATFFNPKSGLVHVAIGDPGLVHSVDPRSNTSMQFSTAAGATTTALVEPDRLYVFSPVHEGVLDLRGA